MKKAVKIIIALVVVAAIAVGIYFLVKPNDKDSKPTKYSITYLLDGGVNSPDNPIEYDGVTAITLNPAVKDGYDFAGWYDAADNFVVKIPAGYGKNVRLTAKWAKQSKLSYILETGVKNDNPTTYSSVSKFTLKAPVKEGTTFSCWVDQYGRVIKQFPLNMKELGALTLTPYWASEGLVVENGVVKHVSSNQNYSGEVLAFPENTTAIEAFTFSDNENIKKIIIPSGVKNIEIATFQGCSNLLEVIIPNTVTSIGNNAFYNCEKLKKVIIPDSVTTFDKTAFSCFNFAALDLSLYFENVNKISTLEENEDYFAEKNIKILSYSKDKPLVTGNFWHYDITLNPEEIGYMDSLKEWRELNYISNGSILPSSNPLRREDSPSLLSDPVKSGYVFAGWWDGKGSFITDITKSPYNCLALEALFESKGLKFEDLTSYYKLTISSEFNDSTLVIPKMDKDVYIGAGCFSSNKTLKRVFTMDSVTNIKASAFLDCSNLEEVYLSWKVNSETTKECQMTSISPNTFKDCVNLKKIKLPKNIKTIGQFAFANTGLKTIHIPENVTTISRNPFMMCKNLTSFTSDSTKYKAVEDGKILFEISTNSNGATTNKIISSVLTNSASIIANMDLNKYATSDKVEISKFAFAGADLVTLDLSDLSKKIDVSPYAFANCDYLKNVFISKNMMGYSYFSFASEEDKDTKPINYFMTQTIDTYPSTLSINEYSKMFYYSVSLPNKEGNWWCWNNEDKTETKVWKNVIVKINGDYDKTSVSDFEYTSFPISLPTPKGTGTNDFMCWYDQNYKTLNNVIRSEQKYCSFVINGYMSSSGMKFEIENGEAILTSFADCSDSFAIIPSTYNGYKVTKIGFELEAADNNVIKKLYIPNTINSLSSLVFYHLKNLETIIFADGIKTLNGYRDSFGSFYGDIIFPSSLTTISDDIFTKANSKSIYLGVDYDTALKRYSSVTFPETTTFNFLVDSEDNIKKSGYYYTLGKKDTLYYPTTEDLFIPKINEINKIIYNLNPNPKDTVTNNSSNPTQVSSTSVDLGAPTSANRYEFYTWLYENEKITSIEPTMPRCVVLDALWETAGLTFAVITGKAVITGYDHALTYGDNLVLPSKKTISGKLYDLNTIDAYAFKNSKFKKVYLMYSSSITLGESCFKGSRNLEKIYNYSQITSIPDYAFENCVNFAMDEFVQNIKYFGKDSFKNTGLQHIVLKQDATFAVDKNGNHYNPFSYCKNLISLEFYTKLSTLTAGKYYAANDTLFYCLSSNALKIITATPNTKIKDFVAAVSTTFGETNYTISIANNAFAGINFANQTISLTSNVYTIESNAFADTNADIIKFESGCKIQDIGVNAFKTSSPIKICVDSLSQIEDAGDQSGWNPNNKPIYQYSVERPTNGGYYWHYADSTKTKILFW